MPSLAVGALGMSTSSQTKCKLLQCRVLHSNHVCWSRPLFDTRNAKHIASRGSQTEASLVFVALKCINGCCGHMLRVQQLNHGEHSAQSDLGYQVFSQDFSEYYADPALDPPLCLLAVHFFDPPRRSASSLALSIHQAASLPYAEGMQT